MQHVTQEQINALEKAIEELKGKENKNVTININLNNESQKELADNIAKILIDSLKNRGCTF